jgi:hypothetical protein
VDFVRRWSEKTEIGAGCFIVWLDITASKFYDWRERRKGERAQRLGSPLFLAGGLGEAGRHRVSLEEPAGRLPPAEVHDARRRHRGSESDQRLAGVGQAGLLSKWNGKPSKKGTGFEQPVAAGISTFRTSTSAELSITCAAFWTAAAVTS